MDSVFNVEDIYNTMVEPLLQEIDEKCKKYQIPYTVLFAVRSTGNETMYVEKGILPDQLGLTLTQDRFHFLRGKRLSVTKTSKYNKNSLFGDHLRVPVNQLRSICGRRQIPFTILLAVADDGKLTTYEGYTCFPSDFGLQLSDDRFLTFVRSLGTLEELDDAVESDLEE